MSRNHLTIQYCLLSVLLFWASTGVSFPSFVRAGYVTCVTCHVSPSGGGALTPYGKYVAGELMGAWNDSATALPWIQKPEEDSRFVAMVMARVVQTYFDTPQVRRKNLQNMQFDLEGGFVQEAWQFLVTVGPRLDGIKSTDQRKEDLDIRRFSAGYVSGDWAVRAGRFFPEYGLYVPNHNVPTRKGLYFNHNEEPRIFQVSRFTPQSYDMTVAYLVGEKDTQLEDKKGYSGTFAYKANHARYGLSTLSMKGDDGSRTGSTGVFAQLGYGDGKEGWTLIEANQKRSVNIRGNETREQLGYLETGWMLSKGLSPIATFEYSKNLQSGLEIKTPYLGLIFMPITHFEIHMQAGRSEITVGGEKEYSTLGFIMGNVYF